MQIFTYFVSPENLAKVKMVRFFMELNYYYIYRDDGYFEGLPISIIESWYQRDGYIKSMADLIQKELLSFSNSEEVINS